MQKTGSHLVFSSLHRINFLYVWKHGIDAEICRINQIAWMKVLLKK